MINCLDHNLDGKCDYCGREVLPNIVYTCLSAQKASSNQCEHFLGATKETLLVYGCGCNSSKEIGIESTIGGCALYGKCSLWSKGGKLSDPSVVLCHTCPVNPKNQSGTNTIPHDVKPATSAQIQKVLARINQRANVMNWAYGITTVPSRAKTLLAQTLQSLANAGFDKPVLFVDGMEDGWEPPSLSLGGVVMMHPKVGHIPNWMIALLHLYSTKPQADLYAIFEDDLLATKGLREYLERCPYPERGYWNLLTHPENLFLTQGVDGWHLSNQRGRGAVGLVFSREVARAILSSHVFLDRPIVGCPAADGMVMDSLGVLGYKEYIHCPTLLQHVGGGQSVMGHKYGEMPGWRGEDFDLSTIHSAEEIKMNEGLALARMISPGMPRPSVWLGGVIQIHVTRACDMACNGCTQGSNLRGKPVMISVEDFELACQSLAGYWGVVGMFGGNPAIHPEFEKLCEIFSNHFPFEQRGLWCNNPLGKGKVMRKTFNPRASNLNVHLNQEAFAEFKMDWPECNPFGLHEDSRHSPPYVAMKDVIEDESERWKLIANCDINKYWSAMVCSVPGKGLRGFFCEIAGAQAMLHADDPSWPDTGVEVTPGWWQLSMHSFVQQVRVHCHSCGVPLRRFGQLATSSGPEEVSKTHADIYLPKVKDREVQLVQIDTGKKLGVVTSYVENSHLVGDSQC